MAEPKYKTPDKGQKKLAKYFRDKHDAVLFIAPSSEPQPLTIILKDTAKGRKAHHLGVFDGTLLERIPDNPANRRIRERLIAAGCQKANGDSSRLTEQLGDYTSTLENTSDVRVGVRARVAGFFSNIFASRNTEKLAKVTIDGMYSERLDYSTDKDLISDITAVKFGVSVFDEGHVTIVTRLFFAKKMEMSFRSSATTSSGATGGARAPVMGATANASTRRSHDNTRTETYDNTDPNEKPIAVAARVHRFKIVPIPNSPRMVKLELLGSHVDEAEIEGFHSEDEEVHSEDEAETTIEDNHSNSSQHSQNTSDRSYVCQALCLVKSMIMSARNWLRSVTSASAVSDACSRWLLFNPL